MWRIAQEAVVNVERHARASQLAVTWRCDGQRAELVVSDDGVGLRARASPADSTPTASSACASGPPASVPASTSTPTPAVGRRCACWLEPD